MSRNARLVATTFALDFASADRGEAFPSLAVLGELAGCCERAARYAVAELERCGWLVVERRRGRGRTSTYRFRFPPGRGPDEEADVVALNRRPEDGKPAKRRQLHDGKTGSEASRKPATPSRQFKEGITHPPAREREGPREAPRNGPPRGLPEAGPRPEPDRAPREEAPPSARHDRGSRKGRGGDGGRRWASSGRDRPARPELTPEQRQAAILANDDRLAAWINGPKPIPCSAVPSDAAHRLLEAEKVTRQRMREKGLPW